MTDKEARNLKLEDGSWKLFLKKWQGENNRLWRKKLEEIA